MPGYGEFQTGITDRDAPHNIEVWGVKTKASACLTSDDTITIFMRSSGGMMRHSSSTSMGFESLASCIVIATVQKQPAIHARRDSKTKSFKFMFFSQKKRHKESYHSRIAAAREYSQRQRSIAWKSCSRRLNSNTSVKRNSRHLCLEGSYRFGNFISESIFWRRQLCLRYSFLLDTERKISVANGWSHDGMMPKHGKKHCCTSVSIRSEMNLCAHHAYLFRLFSESLDI